MLRPCVASLNSMSYARCCKIQMSEKEMSKGVCVQRIFIFILRWNAVIIPYRETANKLRCEKIMFPTPCPFHCRTFYTVQSLNPWFNKHNVMYCFGFFLSFNYLNRWQLSIWNYGKIFLSLLYKCQILCSWRLFWSRSSYGLFFPDIATSRTFTTNSLCLIICTIQECRLFFKICKLHCLIQT
jgi:hypothetical protein